MSSHVAQASLPATEAAATEGRPPKKMGLWIAHCYYRCSTISSIDFSTSNANKAPETKAPAPAAATSKTAIAVLPFTNLSEDKDQEYFSDGLDRRAAECAGKESEAAGHLPHFRLFV